MINNIAVFGGAEVSAETQLYKDVFEFSKLLAQKGHTIVNGGGPGVMLAATQGAEAGGGQTLAVTFNPKDAPGFEGKYIKNETDKLIITDNYIARMFTLMENADCYVITNGGTGTLSELGTAWCLARLYFGNHRPFILYGDFWHKIIKAIADNMLLREQEYYVFKFASSPEDVVRAVEEFNQELYVGEQKSELLKVDTEKLHLSTMENVPVIHTQ